MEIMGIMVILDIMDPEDSILTWDRLIPWEIIGHLPFFCSDSTSMKNK